MLGSTDAKRYAAKIARRLARAYPDAACCAGVPDPLELLVATILSAQCTDRRVNLVTQSRCSASTAPRPTMPRPRWRNWNRTSSSTGFFHNKAKTIRACCRILVERFGGKVPREMEELVALPGIGRKTANVVLGTAYGIASGVVVDTHVIRLSQRLGLTGHKEPAKIEQDLMASFPQSEWIMFSHRLIHHGRRSVWPGSRSATSVRWGTSARESA